MWLLMLDNSDDEWGTAVEDGFLSEDSTEDDDEEGEEPRFRRMTREEAMSINNPDSEDEE